MKKLYKIVMGILWGIGGLCIALTLIIFIYAKLDIASSRKEPNTDKTTNNQLVVSEQNPVLNKDEDYVIQKEVISDSQEPATNLDENESQNSVLNQSSITPFNEEILCGFNSNIDIDNVVSVLGNYDDIVQNTVDNGTQTYLYYNNVEYNGLFGKLTHVIRTWGKNGDGFYNYEIWQSNIVETGNNDEILSEANEVLAFLESTYGEYDYSEDGSHISYKFYNVPSAYGYYIELHIEYSYTTNDSYDIWYHKGI